MIMKSKINIKKVVYLSKILKVKQDYTQAPGGKMFPTSWLYM